MVLIIIPVENIKAPTHFKYQCCDHPDGSFTLSLLSHT